eukprot:PhF_6_TR35034/c0_g1_i1/m.51050/K00757/udp, UPP; uridine phosphorylase
MSDPEVPIDNEGRVYHIAAKSSDVADKIMLVGDPGRVPIVAEYFDKGSVTFDHSHREIRTITGSYKGDRMTVMSTGMGTDNLEIIMHEIHILKEYDYPTKTWCPKEKIPRVVVIRMGTCGCPRPEADVKCGSLAISKYAIGMDNTGSYYNAVYNDKAEDLERLLKSLQSTPLAQMAPYVSYAHPEVVQALEDAAKRVAATRKAITGITATASGFYGCQGRLVGRVAAHCRIPNLVDALSALQFSGTDGTTERVVNIEMETSSLCRFANILGYRGGAVCAIIAKRAGDVREFASAEEYKNSVASGILVTLEALRSFA